MNTLAQVYEKRCPFMLGSNGVFGYCIACECMAFRQDSAYGNYYCIKLENRR